MVLLNSRRSKSRLRMDPTRTTLLRQRFVADVVKGFTRLQREITKLIVDEDAFGLKRRSHNPAVVIHERYVALTSKQQLEEFRRWLKGQVDTQVLRNVDVGAKNWLEQYIKEAYEKGSGRSFDDYMTKYKEYYGKPADFYQGTRDEFLRSAFRRPASVERVQLLASRAYTDLKGVTEAMSTQMNRIMTDGIIQGKNPKDLARELNKSVEGIGKNRARTIARTEMIRAHADGQLEALKNLGVTEVGVMVEWSTASDDLVCDLCADMDGAVLQIKDAGILIPRHPNCLPGDSLVSPSGRITAVSERHYEGDLVVIRTASGRVLSCTPNHPILTNLGWVPAESLDLGSHVVCDGRSQWKPPYDNKDKNLPTSIKEVASAFRKASEVTATEVPLSSPDFHGDASDGQVAVVWTDSSLLAGDQPAIVEHPDQLLLVGGNVEDGIGLSGHRSQGSFADTPLATDDCRVSSCRLSQSLSSVHSRPLHELGLTLAPEADVVGNEDSSNHATPNTKVLGDLVFRGSTDIPLHDDFIMWADRNLAVFPTFDEVVTMDRRRYDGHVYNLQTEDEWYGAEGIITHNCRCAWLPANIGEDTKDQKRGRQAEKALEQSIKDEIPKKYRDTRTVAEQRILSRWKGADKEKLGRPLKSPLYDKAKPGPKPKPKLPGTPKVPKVKVAPPSAMAAPTAEETMAQFQALSLEEKLKHPMLDDLRKKYLEESVASELQMKELTSRWVDYQTAITHETHRFIDLTEKIDAAGALPRAEYAVEVTKLKEQRKIISDRVDLISQEMDRIKLQRDSLQLSQQGTMERTLGLPAQERCQIKGTTPDVIVDYYDHDKNVWRKTLDAPERSKDFEASDRFLSSLMSNRNGVQEVKYTSHILDEGERAFCKPTDTFKVQSQQGIYVTAKEGRGVITHEIGHELEAQVKDGHKLAKEFRDLRVTRAGTADVKLADQFPGYNYRADEIGNKDEFDKALSESSAYYVGKNYGKHELTEVVSMGVQALIESPLKLAEKDPEYFNFIIGYLRGVL